jgi:hypothetical protein
MKKAWSPLTPYFRQRGVASCSASSLGPEHPPTHKGPER